MRVFAVVVADGRATGRRPEGRPVYLGEFIQAYPQTGNVGAGERGSRHYSQADAVTEACDLERGYGRDLDGRREYVFGVRPVQVEEVCGDGER